MDYDVVVVGAGPAGSMAAKYAAKHGARTLLLEEHAMIGSPVSCTGHVSTKTIVESELGEGSYINKRIRGAFVYSPDCQSIPVDGRRTMTFVIERKIFDREIARAAANEGSEVWVNASAKGLNKVTDGISLDVIHEGKLVSITSKVVIGADGVKSQIARLSGLGMVPHVCSAIQVEASFKPRDPEFVEIFSGKDYAPGYFAWAVPTAGDCCRIGLIADTNAHLYLNKLLKEHPEVSKRAKSSVDLILGGIPVGTLKKTVAPGVMVVGDAAGQVKPVSYGGLYWGMKCAKIAGEVAAKASIEGDTGIQRLLEYEMRWRSEIGRELMIGLKFRDIYNRMTDADINEAVSALNDPDILDTITRYGDIDNPSMLARQLITMKGKIRLWRIARLFARVIV